MNETEARRLVEERHGMEFGVEYVGLATGEELAYVNRGDTYDETLVRTGVGAWRWSSWGDEVEQAESQHYADTGEQRCFCCGELAECKHHATKSWDGYACASCREKE